MAATCAPHSQASCVGTSLTHNHCYARPYAGHKHAYMMPDAGAAFSKTHEFSMLRALAIRNNLRGSSEKLRKAP
jgi:hypothetical protein